MNRAHVTIALIVVLAGCNESDLPAQNDEDLCENPVEFSNEKNAAAHSFLVGIDSNKEVNAVAVSFLEKYEDLEVYGTLTACNCFHANSGDETLAQLACEPDVSSLHYNNPDSVN